MRITGEKKFNIICIILILVMIIPILIYSFYSIPCVDDFVNGASMRDEYLPIYGSFLPAAFHKTIDMYNTTSGYYFAAFLNFFFQPMLKSGITGIRIFNFIINLIFFISLYFLVRVCVKKIITKKTSVVMGLFFICSFWMINNYVNYEIYTWYCALVAYILPLSLLFIGLALFILSVKKKNTILLVITSVLGFLVSGSSLNVTALVCELFFVLGFWAYYENKNLLYGIIGFGAAFLGAIINVIAPGNYARHSLVTDNYDLFKAVINSAETVGYRFFELITSKPYIPFIIIIFVLIYNLCNFETKKITFKHPIIIGIVELIGLVVINFPVCLGYDSNGLPARTIFVQDLAIYLYTMVWIFYFIGFLKKQKKIEKIKKEIQVSAIISCALFLIMLISVFGTKVWTTAIMIKSIVNGNAKEFAIAEENMLSEIENSEEDEVTVIHGTPFSDELITGTEVTSDPNCYKNIAIAMYYEKKSVTVVFLE